MMIGRGSSHHFGSLCDLLASYGMTASVEFLIWTRMRGVSEVVALLQAANRANAGMVIDTLHFFRSGCEIESCAAFPRSCFTSSKFRMRRSYADKRRRTDLCRAPGPA